MSRQHHAIIIDHQVHHLHCSWLVVARPVLVVCCAFFLFFRLERVSKLPNIKKTVAVQASRNP